MHTKNIKLAAIYEKGLLTLLVMIFYLNWLYKHSSQTNLFSIWWSTGKTSKGLSFNICLYLRLHKFTSDQLFCYFCTRDGPLDKRWAGRVIQKIHARDEKADNWIATKNFWAATLYSSVLSPSGIPFTWLSLQLGKWTPISFQAYIFCV